jgi:hypothetical protein
LTYPAGVTEESFLAAVNLIARVLAKKAFGPHDEGDVAQLVAVWSLEAVHRYDPAKGSLDSLLYSHCSNQLSNLRRNETGCRTDYPCRVCYEHAIGAGDGHEDGSVCPQFAAWWERRLTKGRLARPVGIDKVFVEGESRMKADSMVETEVEMQELIRLIDVQLPLELRADYLRLRAGEWASIPIPRRRAVRHKVAEILREAGVDVDGEPDEQDVGRPD